MLANNFKSRVLAPAVRQASRKMSGHASQDETRAEIARWKQFTAGMIVLSATFGVYNYFFHTHDHRREGLPYLKNRAKPFPWHCGDCDLFDYGCWDKCKGRNQPAEVEEEEEEAEEEEHAEPEAEGEVEVEAAH